MESESSIRSISTERATNRTVFVCGFVSKRWHNSALQAVIQDLISEYYVACNAETWDENTPNRALLSNAEALLFFVNEFTLGDKNCLLNLQYAWHLMVPVIMLRPPRTKLVITKREQTHDDILIVGNGSIVRSPSTRWSLLEDSTMDSVDYGLLQDVLHEGYKLSIIYDRLDHKTSMKKISARLKQVMRPSLLRESEQRPFYLSPSNGPELTERSYNSGEIATERGVTVTESVPTEPNLRLTQSLSNLKADHSGPPRTPHPHANGTRKKKPAKLPPVITPSESQEQLPAVPQSASTTTSHPPSILSRTSSRERRMR
ncbi:hypothetical protein Y032_0179g705 [Ancylostoma ceylanicum]|uniref:Uncharacterized protein n=3 Tax=Ancylostoma ceylanicum TaxID=53326 RepID=A0A016STK7_9BILA|nr:hypothetical protein Y032_0179g705 [Ancylostoma ceylanicum]